MSNETAVDVEILGSLSERVLGNVEVEFLVRALQSEHAVIEDAMHAEGHEWHEFDDVEHDHGLGSGTVTFLRGGDVLAEFKLEDVSEVFSSTRELVFELSHPKGFFYARIEWEGDTRETFSGSFSDIEEWDSVEASDVFDEAVTMELGVFTDIRFTDDESTYFSFDTSGDPGHGDGLLFFSKGSDGDARGPGRATIVDLAELRGQIESAGVTISDDAAVEAFLTALLD